MTETEMELKKLRKKFGRIMKLRMKEKNQKKN